MKNSKRYVFILTTLTVVVLFATSCKRKCYDCLIRNDQNVVIDTANTICSDSPQYTGSYFASWKVACESAGGETVKRDD